MGCFIACFGSSKNGQVRNHRNKVLPRDHRSNSYKLPQVSISSPNQEIVKVPITPVVSEIQYREDEPKEPTSSGKKKKVTFDSNIKTYDPVPIHEITDHEPEIEETGMIKKENNIAKSNKFDSGCEDGSKNSSLGSFPPNHRYQYCRESDDEIEESEFDESDLDDEDLEDEDGYNYDYSDDEDLEDEDGYNYDYSDDEDDEHDSHSSMESRTGISMHKVIKKELANGSIHSVLNPVENLTQWKAIKAARGGGRRSSPPPLKHQKENCSSLDQQVPKSKPEFPKHQNQEIAVDSSLSNWLVSSESTPKIKNTTPETRSYTPRNLEDRPIIGSVGSFWSRDSDKYSGSEVNTTATSKYNRNVY